MTGDSSAASHPWRAMPKATHLRVASALLHFVAIVQIIGGCYDILAPMPSFHETWLGAARADLDPRVVRLDGAQMDAIGGLLIASGLTLLILVRGPLMLGDRSAMSAILVLVLIGQAGNAWGMFQVGSPYWVPLIEIGLVIIALGLVTVALTPSNQEGLGPSHAT